MSKIITTQKTLLRTVTEVGASKATPTTADTVSLSSMSGVEFDDFSSSSILEFLTKEQECCSDTDAETIFREVNRLAGSNDTRSVDEILREAELLMNQQVLLSDADNISLAESTHQSVSKKNITLNTKYTKRIENVRPPLSDDRLVNGHCLSPSPTACKTMTKINRRSNGGKERTGDITPSTPSLGRSFAAFVENLPSESVISEESTPKDMQTFTNTERDASTTQFNDDAVESDDGTDTMEEITEAMETIELVHEEPSAASKTKHSESNDTKPGIRPPYAKPQQQQQQQQQSPSHRVPLNFNATQECSPGAWEPRTSNRIRKASITSDSGLSHTQSTSAHASPQCSKYGGKSCLDKSVNSSPYHLVSAQTSPIESGGLTVSREHALKQEIELLQEKLKDTEERLQSLRIQHDSLSQIHRDLRDSNTQLQEESELLKLDVQHLSECANLLRSELQAARADRSEALELQKTLQIELEEHRQEKKRTLEQKEKDGKVIQDLQRQCREMERILMRKHPDSVSALIVASKNPSACKEQESPSSRKLLEQRIAQLESDAKEQDHKAQQILANVQARFNAVQAKYETHIADLETQVLSLQEINTKLNEKLESQVRTLEYFVNKKVEKCANNATQTEVPSVSVVTGEEDNSAVSSLTNTMSTQTNATALTMRDHSTNTIGGTSNVQSASSSTSSTANSTPNNSRPNSKQSGIRKPVAVTSSPSMLASKLPVSISDSTISLTASTSLQTKDATDAHLVATIRGMRIDLAIKEKAVQRLTRELDECKRTIKRLQRDNKEALRGDKPAQNTAAASRRHHESHDHVPASTETQALREAHSKMKLLEADYKSLHEKRLQDLKSLQSSHERELASYNETVRMLQQRLNERDETFSIQKRRKLPVDYYALKAKVSSLERRHIEREERLHLLVETLSKGRLNGALEDLLSDNNNQ